MKLYMKLELNTHMLNSKSRKAETRRQY